QGYLDTRTPLLIALATNTINFILDPILIFQAGLGVQGAAISTVIAEWIGAASFLYLLTQKWPPVR
ncbi:unnamed protein product, partial [Discosporangium mesarthrocarpum]